MAFPTLGGRPASRRPGHVPKPDTPGPRPGRETPRQAPDVVVPAPRPTTPDGHVAALPSAGRPVLEVGEDVAARRQGVGRKDASARVGVAGYLTVPSSSDGRGGAARPPTVGPALETGPRPRPVGPVVVVPPAVPRTTPPLRGRDGVTMVVGRRLQATVDVAAGPGTPVSRQGPRRPAAPGRRVLGTPDAKGGDTTAPGQPRVAAKTRPHDASPRDARRGRGRPRRPRRGPRERPVSARLLGLVEKRLPLVGAVERGSPRTTGPPCLASLVYLIKTRKQCPPR